MTSKQRPRNGTSRQQPKPDAPAKRPADRIISVRSRRETFNRAGLRFTATVPVVVKESEVGPDRFAAILAEPQLRCEEA